MLQKIKRKECKLVCSTTSLLQGEDTEVRQGGCWFVLTRRVSLCSFWCMIKLYSPKPI